VPAGGRPLKTCEYDGDPFPSAHARSHPWTDAVASEAFRYYDLKASPSLIRTSLEDFVPWSRYAAVDGFYALLEWLNGATSPFESNDCAFTAPHANESEGIHQPFACAGRVMLLFRDLPLNVSAPDVAWLKDALHLALGPLDETLELGIVGTTLVPVRYLTLPVGEQLGQELMVSFWAWGGSEADVMANLARVMVGLSTALHQVSTEV
jgi:hypothetical protein